MDAGEDILDLAARFAHEPGTVLLLSGGDLDTARHHVLGVRPWLTFSARGGVSTLTDRDGATTVPGDPFAVLADLLERHRVAGASGSGPLASGLLGYLAYDLKDHLERLPRTSVDDLQLPGLLLYAPAVLIVDDRRTGRRELITTGPEPAVREQVLAQLAAAPPPAGAPPQAGTVRAGVAREAYLEAVRTIQELILAGDVYQVNYTQRFQAPLTGDPFALLRRLHAANPASFFAFVQAGDHQVVSTSPERFLRRRGPHVESRPIKGTRSRGGTPAADAALRAELLASAKDDAELSMIVDLVRNDLGKVCRPGTVRVAAHKVLQSYRNVHHLVSVVTGELDPGRGTVDLVRAAFPAGSITGCPKIRAMEIIDQLEPCRRHVYCGSLGYLGFDDTCDLSVAIRTATIIGGMISWSVGGGIVADSDPAAEYAESLHKGRTLAEACGVDHLLAGAPDPHEPRCWHNGRLVPLSTAMVPVGDLGLLRGFGLFETLRADHGRAPLLADHVARLEASWRVLMPSEPPDLTWQDIIADVLAANGLAERPALVRVVATRGTREAPPWDHCLTVTAVPYTHRLVAFGVDALRLATYPEPRQNPLAAHKTLSYIYYTQAGAWARAQGCHEALILNPDGSVSEGNSCGILVVRGRTVTRPESPAALPSVMAAAVCRQLAAWGYAVEVAPVRPAELATADLVMATSGMMGAVPVGSVDGRACRTDSDLWRRLDDAIIPGWDHELDKPPPS
ncbi:MAG: aminodeoxychorismate synthase component I [Candidatus Krumholzibacteriia bacterium]